MGLVGEGPRWGKKAMTQTTSRAERSVEPVPADPVPKRPVVSRLSLGHLIMVLAGLLAFLLVLLVLRQQGETVEIAVTGAQVEAGTTLTAGQVNLVEVSATDASALGALLTPEVMAQIVDEGWVATRTLAPGVALSDGDFRPASAAIGLRAMSLPIDVDHAANGAIVVGDLVDVIVVRGTVAEYVVTSAEVIAVAVPTGGVSGGGFGLTLAVDAETSLRLAAALNGGSVEVVRSTGASPADPATRYDAGPVDTRGGG
jgi:Flp pilus assembly protein CpaB